MTRPGGLTLPTLFVLATLAACSFHGAVSVQGSATADAGAGAPTSTSATAAGPTDRIPGTVFPAPAATKIRFDPGKNSTTLTDTLDGSLARHYYFDAKQGQSLTLSVTSAADSVRLRLVDPSGKDIQAPPKSSILNATGRYLLDLTSTVSGVQYELQVGIV